MNRGYAWKLLQTKSIEENIKEALDFFERSYAVVCDIVKLHPSLCTDSVRSSFPKVQFVTDTKADRAKLVFGNIQELTKSRRKS